MPTARRRAGPRRAGLAPRDSTPARRRARAMGVACSACETIRGTSAHGWDVRRGSFNPAFDARGTVFEGFAGPGDALLASEAERWLVEALGMTREAAVKALKGAERAADGSVAAMELLRAFALGEGNFPFAPSEVDEDAMGEEMSSYFINSSHNTYLEGDQLFSRATGNAIARALLSGCRVVELDVYDGGPGRGPIVTHGGTAVRSMLFADAIKAIHENAHKASDYPAIVTIENHASKETRAVMAKIMRDEFGEKLWTPPNGEGGDNKMQKWPSPRELKGRIIVRDKIKHKQDERAKHGSQLSVRMKSLFTGRKPLEESRLPRALRPRSSKKSLNLETVALPGGLSGSVTEISESDDDDEEEGEEGEDCGENSYKALVTIPNVKFRDFKSATSAPKFSCSWSENALRRNLETASSETIIGFTKEHLLRTYPGGHRILSDNYDPSQAWSIGASLVALNAQAQDRFVWVNAAKFSVNGGCGYVKKPAYLLDPSVPRPTKSRTLRVHVYAGIGWDNFKDADMFGSPDSVIKISLFGCAADQTPHLKSKRTSMYSKARSGPTAQPIWNEHFDLEILEPELTVMQITAIDRDGSRDEFLAHYDFPISGLREGIRIVPMLSRTNELIHDSKSCAGVLCRFSWLD